MLVGLLLYLSIALQCIAAFLAISLLKRTKYIISWILISIAFILMAIMRLFDVVVFENIWLEIDLELVNKWFGIVISILFLLGVVFIRKIFNFIDRLDSLRKENELTVLNAVIKTEEKERLQFANDIHDGMGPLLSSAKMSLSSISNENLSITDQKIINNTKLVVDEAIRSIKEISNHLSPHILNNFGLVRAIKNYTAKLNTLNSITIDIDNNIEKRRYNQNIEVVLYRVVTELINNTIKHSQASLVKIELTEKNNAIIIEYCDNGIGFDANKISNNPQGGMGYDNMRNRLKSISSQMFLETGKGKGVYVKIETPLRTQK